MNENNNNNIHVELVEFVKTRDYITFAELERFLEPQGIKIRGDYYYGIPPMNIAYWMAMSEEFVDIIGTLVENKKLFVHPAQFFTYVADGCCLKLPLVKKLPAKGYKELHWLPVCFRTVPYRKLKEI